MSKTAQSSCRKLISIGMPVFNAENYLSESIQSLLSQTYSSIELIISDNASTDATEEICRDWEKKDNRISYIRQEENQGAAFNYNFVAKQARGPYFRWAAHDDLSSPDSLEETVKLLESDPSTVLAFSRSVFLDSQGREIGDYEEKLNLHQSRPFDRISHLIKNLYWTDAFYGVMRLETLKETGMHQDFIAADVYLLAELALLGKIKRAEKSIFYRRIHSEMSSLVFKGEKEEDLLAWFNPKLKYSWKYRYNRLLFEELKLLLETKALQPSERFKATYLLFQDRYQKKRKRKNRPEDIRARITYRPGQENVYP